MLIKLFSVYINISVYNLNRFPRKSDDPFNIVSIFFISVRKYNDLVTLRLPEPGTGNLIYDKVSPSDKVVSIVNRLICSSLSDKCNDQIRYRHDQHESIQDPTYKFFIYIFHSSQPLL